MRKGMMATGLAMAAMVSLPAQSVAATVRAGDSLPTTTKRIAVRVGEMPNAAAPRGASQLVWVAGVVVGVVILGTIYYFATKSP